MGLLPVSNHQALIRDCYPTKILTTTPISELKPDSNALSKLCFYSQGRPKKLPKVAQAILERAERDARTSSGAKPRAQLAVTVDIVRGLVSECRAELHCFAEQALKVAELALGRKEAGQRDPVLEARGAALFHAVSVFSSASVALDNALIKQYFRCLSMISSMAQLGSKEATSRWIALSALDGAVASELLYAAASDYEGQIRLIVPALFYNCIDLPVPELRKHFDESSTDTSSPSSLGLVAARKSSPITVPEATPTASTLASKAVRSLRTTVRLSHGVQLSTKLSATSDWLDRHAKGALWAQEDLVEWIGSSGVAATAVQYRAGVVTWWVDQVSDINSVSPTQKKHETLVDVLSSILRGPTSLVGLGIGTVLAQLTALLVRRVPLGDNDPLSPKLLDAISGLASHVYYYDQLNDVVADLIETIRVVKSGGGPSASFSDKDRSRALRKLVSALRGVLAEAQESESDVVTAAPMSKSNSASPSTKSVNGTTGASMSRPPLPQGEGTIRGNGVLLGNGQGIRSKKETNGAEVMKVVAQPGRRNRVSADVFKDSFFLLSEKDPVLRLDYQKALLLFVESELDVGASGEDGGDEDAWKDSSRFFDELHAAVYDSATAFTAAPVEGRPDSPVILRTPPRPRTKSSASKKSRSRQSSYASMRRSTSPVGVQSASTACDYYFLKKIVEAAQSRGSSIAVVSGVQMLLALERDVNQFVSANDNSDGADVRVQACREIVASGLVTISKKWAAPDMERLAQSALDAQSPSVLPSSPVYPDSQFATDICLVPPPVNETAIVDTLTSSQKLQAASGLDRSTLAASLSVPWNNETARIPAHKQDIYRRADPTRSVTNLSTIRVNRTPDRAGSVRAPSLADLQTSLGRPGSVHTSATPSIASTHGTVSTYNTGRRTAKTAASQVLAGLSSSGSRNSSRLSVVGRTGSGRIVMAAKDAAHNAARYITA
ncbi:hypothetical protein T439DRAFT_323596 [Meredithblackwellia eburnea MCA 4105]